MKSLACFFIVMGLLFSGELSVAQKAVQKQNSLPTGKIIFITGSCSSGKSSMANIIAQKLHAKSFAFDEYVMPLILKKFITKHYGKFLAFFINGFVSRNFFTSIGLLSEKRKYKMQLKFFSDLQQGLGYEPTVKMYREVKKAALQGHNVVVESPLYLWGGVDFLRCLSEFDGMDITYVLAYCPWNDLIDRIKKRNSTPHKKTHRELDWVLGNFMYNFDVFPERRDENFLEVVNGRSVHTIITEYAQAKYKKQRMCLLPETQQISLQKFPKAIDYYVYPRFKYDITINTKTHNPEQGAAVVLVACKTL